MSGLKEKKVKKEKRIETQEEEVKVAKKSIKRPAAAIDEDEEEEKPKKKAKKDAKVAVDENGDEEEVETRRRTRSMSEGEDSFRKMLTPEEFRKLHQITVTGKSADGVGTYECPPAMVTFASTPFAPPIRKCLDAAGFTCPTPTQAQAWPIALSGRDVITVARTGSGKTCGFLLPAMHRLMMHKDRKRGQPAILVLAPTRELACQIEEEAVKFGRSSNMRSACCYGGAPKSIQIRKVQAGLEVLICTPGRLNDLIEMNIVSLREVLFLVLDEADRMLDMGFEPQIRSIIAQIPSDRQSMMFTATWPREVQSLAREFLRNPVEIKFGDTNNLNANKAIKQVIKVVSESAKSQTLQDILKEINPGGDPEKVPKTIIFVSRKSACDGLANQLWEENYSVDSLHGDKMQFQRTKVMEDFKRSKLRILVATDVAARGLDVKDIEVVINYDFPAGSNGVEDYVHRIGRTGRGEATGKAYTFFTADDSKRGPQLIGVLRRADQEVPAELLKYDRAGGFGGFGGFGGRGGRGGGFRGRGGGGGYGGGRGGGGRAGFGEGRSTSFQRKY